MAGHIKLLSWNVNGVRSLWKKGLLDRLKELQPDILCLQETKSNEEQLPPELAAPEGYHAYWHSAKKKGYSGVATFSKVEPAAVITTMGKAEFDDEGRFMRLDYDDFTLFNVYFPNGKSGPARLDYKMRFYDTFLEILESLRKDRQKLIFVGDVNTAHNEIDLGRPKENSKVSGFLPIERAWMDKVVSKGYVDSFRNGYPDEVKYSWWDLKTRARERNVGWRIDYVFVSRELADNVQDAFILNEIMGSDHCPVGIILRAD
jgi:exodeoxyribonuclease III